MVSVHDYEKRYAEAFAITKMRTFKHEPFFIAGGGGGGGGELIRGTLRYMYNIVTEEFTVMEILSLNTSLFSGYLYNNTTIKSFWNHYVIGKHIINIQSRSDLILSSILFLHVILCYKKFIYPAGRVSDFMHDFFSSV